jgi:hypothetical protein
MHLLIAGLLTLPQTRISVSTNQVRTFLRVRRAHGGYPGHPRADYLQVSILRLGQLLPDLVI